MILEDEPLARSLMVEYVSHIETLRCVAECNNAFVALDFLKNNPVDLIFLDLHLPQLKGLEFIKKLDYFPSIIITTAYHQYALESYDHPVLDYLVKPIEFTRFERAIEKFELYQNRFSKKLVERAYTFIRTNSREVKIFLDEIMYIESELEYLKIFRKQNEVIRIRHTMKGIQKVLKPLQLVRIHRSFLVVSSKVTSISSKTISIDEVQLPIGRQYRNEAQNMLKN